MCIKIKGHNISLITSNELNKAVLILYGLKAASQHEILAFLVPLCQTIVPNSIGLSLVCDLSLKTM